MRNDAVGSKLLFGKQLTRAQKCLRYLKSLVKAEQKEIDGMNAGDLTVPQVALTTATTNLLPAATLIINRLMKAVKWKIKKTGIATPDNNNDLT